MLEDAYRGERATPAIQRVIGQKPWCLFDDRDETFPYPLHHLLDRLVGQQSVLAYRYIHLLTLCLCPLLLAPESMPHNEAWRIFEEGLFTVRPRRGVLGSSGHEGRRAGSEPPALLPCCGSLFGVS